MSVAPSVGLVVHLPATVHQGPDVWWSLRLHITGDFPQAAPPASDPTLQEVVVSASANGYASAQIIVAPGLGGAVQVTETNELLGAVDHTTPARGLDIWYENYLSTPSVTAGDLLLTIAARSNGGYVPDQVTVGNDSSLSRRHDPPSDPIVKIDEVRRHLRPGDKLSLGLELRPEDAALRSVSADLSIEGTAAKLTDPSPHYAVPGKVALVATVAGSALVHALVRAPGRQDRNVILGAVRVADSVSPSHTNIFVIVLAGAFIAMGAALLVRARRIRNRLK